jgi:hypothetical protein
VEQISSIQEQADKVIDITDSGSVKLGDLYRYVNLNGI